LIDCAGSLAQSVQALLASAIADNMVEGQTQSMAAPAFAKSTERRVSLVIPSAPIDLPRQSHADRFRNRLAQDSFSPVNQNGSFEFDRVIKSGYVQKRTQKTKVGKSRSFWCCVSFWLITLDLENDIPRPTTEHAVHL
jgi:hypothetical protein